MSWLQIQTFPLESDLTHLSIYLDKLAIPHRFTDELEQQILWVPDAKAQHQALEALQRYKLNPEIARATPALRSGNTPLALPQFNKAPVTYGLLALCILGYFASFNGKIYNQLTFLPFSQGNYALGFAWQYWVKTGEYWRCLTPTFLHWNLLHIVFNSLWLIELGKRLEYYLGARKFVLLFLFLAIGGNYAQYWYAPQNLFGGVSAVIYGLFGFIALAQRADTHPALALPKTLIWVMAGMIIVGFSGLLDFAAGPMANAGHLGGFICGLVAGGVFGFLKQKAA